MAPVPALGEGDIARAIVETVRAPLLVLDENLRVVTANRAYYETFSAGSERRTGSFFEIDGGRWDVAELRTLLERILPERQEVRDFEVRREVSGASTSVVLLNARQLHFEGEGKQLLLLSLEDRSERDRLERELQRHAEELERSNRELEDFAHAASHDLQEPLRKIRMYADEIPELLGDDIDPRAQKYLQRMSEAVQRMRRRVDDLLQLARVSRTPPHRVLTSLRLPLEDALRDLSVAVEVKQARLEVGELGEAEVDPDQFRVVFQNLIGNALKFARPDEPPLVKIFRLPDEAGQCRIVIEDEGIGFEQTFAEKILEPFQRLHNRTEYEGSGVGLAVCKRILEHHAGTITAEGRPNMGARFTVGLPILLPQVSQ